MFERLFKYPTGNTHPIENQLTECLASLCERCPIFKSQFLSLFVEKSYLVGHKVKVETQSRYALKGQSSKSIDLEFWFEDKEENRLLTGFIEVKVHSGENHSIFIDDQENIDFMAQTKIYEKILGQDDAEFGSRVGLYSLTPYTNPLDIKLDTASDKFLPPKNIFFFQVGKIVRESVKISKDPVEIFLLEQFYEYLERIGMMSDQKISIQDLAIMENYLPVKDKMWRSLDRLATHLKARLGGEKTSFKLASSQESQKRFCVYKYLDSDLSLAIFAGYYFRENDIPWVGVWLEMNPKCKEIATIRSELSSEMKTVLKGGSEDFNEFNKWLLFENRDKEWWIACNARQMIDFVNDEQGVDSINIYLTEKVNELLKLKAVDKWKKA